MIRITKSILRMWKERKTTKNPSNVNNITTTTLLFCATIALQVHHKVFNQIKYRFRLKLLMRYEVLNNFAHSCIFYRPESKNLSWSANDHCDVTTTWKFANKFYVKVALLGWNFIELALTVHDLLLYLCFLRFWTVGKLIIYRPAHNF